MLLNEEVNAMYCTNMGEYFHVTKNKRKKIYEISCRVYSNDSKFVRLSCKSARELNVLIFKFSNKNELFTTELLTNLGFK